MEHKNVDKLIVETHLRFTFIQKIKIIIGQQVVVSTCIWLPVKVESANVNTRVGFDNVIKVTEIKNKRDYGYQQR